MAERATVGQVVHYLSRGSADGAFPPACRAALVTEVDGPAPADANEYVGLAVLNPTGLFFDRHLPRDDAAARPGSWHWPERA